MQILLNHGSDVEAQAERERDNHLSQGWYELMEIILSCYDNKEPRNIYISPLSLAAIGGYTIIIQLLLTHGA